MQAKQLSGWFGFSRATCQHWQQPCHRTFQQRCIQITGGRQSIFRLMPGLPELSCTFVCGADDARDRSFFAVADGSSCPGTLLPRCGGGSEWHPPHLAPAGRRV
eukprot:363893-Chlamydomonas_euryale.AAC.3